MIVAAICWYDEPQANIERCIFSLALLGDTLAAIIALDGRWDHMHGPPTSPNPQQRALQLATHHLLAGYPPNTLDAALISGSDWPSQVAKRSHLMQLARSSGQPWTLVIDTDEAITSCDPEQLRHVLTHTDRDVALVHCHRTGTGIRDARRPIRRIYRTDTDITVEHAHNGYRTADGRWLHGDPAYVKLQPPADASPHLIINSTVHSRPPERNRRAEHYHVARRRLRLEAWPTRARTAPDRTAPGP